MKKVRKTSIKKAIALAVVSLFLLTTMVTADTETNGEFAVGDGEKGLIWTIDIEEEFLLGGIVEIISPYEPVGEEAPEFDGGGKSSILIVRSIRFLDENMGLRLRGTSVMEWIRFNGYYHESITPVFIEVWLEDGRYACSNITIGCMWWGSPSPDRIDIDRHGFRLVWHDLENYPLEKIHVHAERVVDNFPPEIHDRTFEKYVFNVAGQSVAEQIVAEQFAVEQSGSLMATEIEMLL